MFHTWEKDWYGEGDVRYVRTCDGDLLVRCRRRGHREYWNGIFFANCTRKKNCLAKPDGLVVRILPARSRGQVCQREGGETSFLLFGWILLVWKSVPFPCSETCGCPSSVSKVLISTLSNVWTFGTTRSSQPRRLCNIRFYFRVSSTVLKPI